MHEAQPVACMCLPSCLYMCPVCVAASWIASHVRERPPFFCVVCDMCVMCLVCCESMRRMKWTPHEESEHAITGTVYGTVWQHLRRACRFQTHPNTLLDPCVCMCVSQTVCVRHDFAIVWCAPPFPARVNLRSRCHMSVHLLITMPHRYSATHTQQQRRLSCLVWACVVLCVVCCVLCCVLCVACCVLCCVVADVASVVCCLCVASVVCFCFCCLVLCLSASDPIPRLRTWLHDHFCGQEYALQLVESLLNTNLYETREQPLVLHMSGPVRAQGGTEGDGGRGTGDNCTLAITDTRL